MNHPYLDKQRFPLTNRQNLSLEQQKLVDAVNLDDLREMQKLGQPLDHERQQILRELEEKRQLR